MVKIRSKFNDNYLSLIVIIFILTFLWKLFATKKNNNADEKVLVRIDVESQQKRNLIKKFILTYLGIIIFN